MKHLIMNKPQCLLYSAAMVLGLPVRRVSHALGHDGMDVWWPQYPDHRKLRSHSMQEIIDVFLSHDKALVPVHAMPMQAPGGSCIDAKPTFEDPTTRFMGHLKGARAIIIGKTKNGNPHAWAWDDDHLLDPRGGQTDINDVAISEAWLMFDIKSNA